MKEDSLYSFPKRIKHDLCARHGAKCREPRIKLSPMYLLSGGTMLLYVIHVVHIFSPCRDRNIHFFAIDLQGIKHREGHYSVLSSDVFPITKDIMHVSTEPQCPPFCVPGHDYSVALVIILISSNSWPSSFLPF